ncbi:MAG: methylated-DNA--[protein]-cysteine S-methyltransferase [Acidobacteriota bacterium]
MPTRADLALPSSTTAADRLPADEATADYRTVEQAIRFLETHHRDQPSLAAVADAVGLSEFHLQRLFRRWAGISPKRFLQFLTAEHAKHLLRAERTVLDSALETGLSGPSRLHDLLVNVEGVTPGEMKTSGRGLQIEIGMHPTPFGDAFVGATDRGLCALSFPTAASRTAAFGDAAERLARTWSEAQIVERPDRTGIWISTLFGDRQPGRQRVNLFVRGTNFQLRVWRALLEIPPRAARSYGDLASQLGAPGASRAVGNAVGANPVAVLIPCHRVLRSSGAFGGYRWGVPRKKAILGWEAARQATASALSA